MMQDWGVPAPLAPRPYLGRKDNGAHAIDRLLHRKAVARTLEKGFPGPVLDVLVDAPGFHFYELPRAGVRGTPCPAVVRAVRYHILGDFQAFHVHVGLGGGQPRGLRCLPPTGYR